MDPRHVSAERLPELYRAILDAVVELERRGARREAGDARRAAARAYRVWDDRAERRLMRLHGELTALLGEPRPSHPRGRWSARLGGTRSSRRSRGGAAGDGLPERAQSA